MSLLLQVENMTQLPSPLVVLVGYYWDSLDSLVIFELSAMASDRDKHFEIDGRIRCWLRRLYVDGIERGTNIEWIQSHLSYYKINYNYDVKSSKPWSRLLVYALASRRPDFVQQVVSLRSSTMCLNRNIKGMHLGKTLHNLREAGLVDTNFCIEGLVKGNEWLCQWVISNCKDDVLKSLGVIAFRVACEGVKQTQGLLELITNPLNHMAWRYLARGISGLDVSEKKSQMLALCHEILDPLGEFARFFETKARYSSVCRSNDVKYARRLLRWPRLKPRMKDRCLLAALKRLLDIGGPGFGWLPDRPPRNDAMLRFLVQEQKITAFQTRECKIHMRMLDDIYRSNHELVNSIRDSFCHSLFISQIERTYFASPRTLALILEKIDQEGTNQVLVQDLVDHCKQSKNKIFKRDCIALFRKYGYGSFC